MKFSIREFNHNLSSYSNFREKWITIIGAFMKINVSLCAFPKHNTQNIHEGKKMVSTNIAVKNETYTLFPMHAFHKHYSF
jgi:hypothetical protein